MGVELFDLRAKVTVEADAALEAYALAHEMDKSEAARDVLHRWAVLQIRASMLLHRRLQSEGIAGQGKE